MRHTCVLLPDRYPMVTEHAMCTMVSGLVSGRTLHDFARGLRLENYLALNASDQYTMRGMSGYAGGVLADAFEALLGALFMDRGLPAARAFLLRLIEVRPRRHAPMQSLGWSGPAQLPMQLARTAMILHAVVPQCWSAWRQPKHAM